MWDAKSGIEVRVKPHGSENPYHEYKAPTTSQLFAGDRNECFIEAVADERYTIEVIAHQRFQWQRAPQLGVWYKVDGGTMVRWVALNNPGKPQAVIDERESFTNYVDGTTVRCGLTFGVVGMVDDPTALSQDEEEAEISRRGKIEVILQRGKSGERKKTCAENKASEPTKIRFLPMPSETTKKVARDSGRSHYLKPVVLDTLSQTRRPSSTWPEWTGAKDEAGQQIIFTFYYTTKEYLEINGVVPLVPLITYPNTADTAIDVEQRMPIQNSLKAIRAYQGPVAHRPNNNEVTSVSTSHLGDDNKRIKVEPDAEPDMEAFAQAKSFTAGEKRTYEQEKRDCDDDEPPSDKRIKLEQDQDCYHMNPQPSDRRSPSRAQPSPQCGPASATVPAQIETEEEEVDILTRLEEIRLERRLRELRARK